MARLSRAALWLFTIFLGLSVGAGLYEARIVVPIWQETPPETWVNTGVRFWVFVTSGPLTLLALASIAMAPVSHRPSRKWWLAALGATLAERLATFGYFIPTMIRLQQQAGGAEVVATLEAWALLNHGRLLLAMAAWLLALKALSKLEAPDERSGLC